MQQDAKNNTRSWKAYLRLFGKLGSTNLGIFLVATTVNVIGWATLASLNYLNNSNDIITKKNMSIQDLEAEIEVRKRAFQDSIVVLMQSNENMPASEVISGISDAIALADSPSHNMGKDYEKLYMTDLLTKLANERKARDSVDHKDQECVIEILKAKENWHSFLVKFKVGKLKQDHSFAVYYVTQAQARIYTIPFVDWRTGSSRASLNTQFEALAFNYSLVICMILFLIIIIILLFRIWWLQKRLARLGGVPSSSQTS